MIEAAELLQRVMDASAQRQLSPHTLRAYRRTWKRLIVTCQSRGLALETLPFDLAQQLYSEITKGRSASLHLQVRAAIGLLYEILGVPNPFQNCVAPKFQGDKLEIRYHTASELAKWLSLLEQTRHTYFDHLTYTLAMALFYTGAEIP